MITKPNKKELEQFLLTRTMKDASVKFKIHERSVYGWLHSYGIKLPSQIIHEKLLTKRQLEVVQGSLLGDGSLTKPVSENSNSYFTENHCLEQAEYLDFKAKEMGDFVSNLTDSCKGQDVRGKARVVRLLQTISHPCFTVLEKKWYKRDLDGSYVLRDNRYRIKVVPEDLVLTPFMVAIWYFDDGWHSQKDRKVELCTNGFTIDEATLLANKLTNLGFQSYSKIDKKDLQSRVCVRSSSYFEFISMVESELKIGSMKYKTDLNGYIPPKHTKTGKDIVEKILQLWRKTKSYQDVATEVGLKRHLVGQILRRHGEVKKRANNKSGVEGVSFRDGLWLAFISVKKKYVHLGAWDTKEEAVFARKEAENLKKSNLVDYSTIRDRSRHTIKSLT